MSYEHLKTAGLDSLESQVGLYGQDLEDFRAFLSNETQPSPASVETDLSTVSQLGQVAVEQYPEQVQD